MLKSFVKWIVGWFMKFYIYKWQSASCCWYWTQSEAVTLQVPIFCRNKPLCDCFFFAGGGANQWPILLVGTNETSLQIFTSIRYTFSFSNAQCAQLDFTKPTEEPSPLRWFIKRPLMVVSFQHGGNMGNNAPNRLAYLMPISLYDLYTCFKMYTRWNKNQMSSINRNPTACRSSKKTSTCIRMRC